MKKLKLLDRTISTKSIVWITLFIFILNILFQFPLIQSAQKTTFGDELTEKLITFPTTGGINISTNVSIRSGTSISNASFKLSTEMNPTEYISDVFLDVGNDNDYEWAFSGVGYGAMGNQTIFNNSAPSISKQYTGSFDQLLTKINLPKNAVINSGQLNISGSYFEFNVKNNVDSNNNTFDCKVGDIDGDSDLDVIVTSYVGASATNSNLVWFENINGNGTKWFGHVIASGLSYPYTLSVGDIDNDNDLDVISVSHPTSSSRLINWYNNTNGNGSTWTSHPVGTIPHTFIYMYNSFIADMNNDSYNDVIITTSNADVNQEDVFWFKNEIGDGSTWTQYNITITTGRCYGLFVADMDGDGDNDTVISTSWNKEIMWFSNTNGLGTTWSSGYTIENALTYPYSVAVADINNDNNPDIASIANEGLYWYEAPNDPTQVNNWVRRFVGTGTGTTGSAGEIVIADMGYPQSPPDGHLDIIVTARTPNDVILYLNDGTPSDGGWQKRNIELDHNQAYALAVGDIDNDTYNDTVVASYYFSTTDDLSWYKFNGSSPSNVTLDIGNDAVVDWIEPSTMDYTTRIPDFKTNLTQYLAQANSYIDKYGNELVSIPIKIVSETPGTTIIDNLEIKYDYTATVNVNPHGTLATELTEAADKISPDENGNCTIPFKFLSGSGGKLKLHDLVIEYNEYPWFHTNIPSLEIPEDTLDNSLLDLSLYVDDDYLDPTKLGFNISYTKGPGKDKVLVSIFNDHYLSVDTLNGSANDNWTGSLSCAVLVNDNYGSTVESDEFDITVTPVNDEPALGPDGYDDFILIEGGISAPIDLDALDYFIDGDSDRLYFGVEFDAASEFFSGNVTIDINSLIKYKIDESTNHVTFITQGDWHAENFPVRIYCDDSKPINYTLFQDFNTTILNINDGPYWDDIPDIELDEDSVLLDAVNLKNYVNDIDDSYENFTFSVITNTNSESIRVVINQNNRINIYPNKQDYIGSAEITVRVTDPGQNYSDETFTITYLAKNDPPVIKLIYPMENSNVASDTVILSWESSDIDSPLENISYKIFFGDTIPPPELPEGQSVSEMQFEVPNLEDGQKYNWRVLATDSEDASLSDIRSFVVDLETRPSIRLLTPEDGSIFPRTTVSFDWEIAYSAGQVLTYNFYLDTEEYPLSKAPLHSELQTSEITVSDLDMGITYYWTVIPKFKTGYGVSENGVYSFTIDPDKKEYGIEVNPTEPELKLKKGESYTFSVNFKNTGSSSESLQIMISPRNISNNIEILHGKSLTIDPEGSRDIEFTIDTTNFLVGKYTFTIIAKSKITPASDSENITLEVTKPKTKTETEGMFNSFFDFLPLLIMIIIFVAILAVIIRYKPKEKPFADDYDYEDVIGRPGSEISYKPPLDEFAKPDWQPKIDSIDNIPAIGPPSDAAGSEIPQLPSPTTAASIGESYSEPAPHTLEPSDQKDELETLEPELEEPDDTGPKVMLPEDIEEPPSLTEPPIETSEAPVTDKEAKMMEEVKLPQFGAPLKLETIEPSSETLEPEEVSKSELDINPDLNETSGKKESWKTSEEEIDSED